MKQVLVLVFAQEPSARNETLKLESPLSLRETHGLPARLARYLYVFMNTPTPSVVFQPVPLNSPEAYSAEFDLCQFDRPV
jgi:hypothetical protein